MYFSVSKYLRSHFYCPLLCLAISCPFLVHAQHKSKQVWYDKEKTKLHVSYYVLAHKTSVIDSVYREYFPNGQLRSFGLYRMNKATGIWEYYYENGKLRMKGEIVNSKNQGIWQYFHENGERYMEGKLENGVRSGDWSIYYDNGKVKSQGAYIKGHPTGTWYYFYEDGTPKAVTNYVQGRGKYLEYYKSGQVKMEGILQDGKSDSVWNYYYENGRLKATGIERNGIKDGFWRFYHDNGLISSEGLYLNGIPFGNWRYYHENGALSSEGSHKNGEKDGFWKLYYPTGEFKAETQFSMGEGPYKEYYESGKLKVKGYIRKGLNEGQWEYFYEDGTVEGKCQFAQGEGNFVGYYPDGKVKMEGRIEDGVKTGVWKLYKPGGELAGFYKTYYEDKKTVFLPMEDTTKAETSKQDTLATNKKTDKEGKSTTLKRRKPARFRYYRRKLNEYKAFIVSVNPVAPLIYRQLPIYLEYMIEERLGFEFIYTFYKNPFLSGSHNLPDRTIYYIGNSFEFMQKFYHKTSNLGSLYFGHSARFKIMDYGSPVADTVTNSNKTYTYKLHQKMLEYSILGGNRIFMSGRSDQPGWTLDFFAGLGIGFMLQNDFNPGSGYFTEDDVFNEVPRNDIYMTGKLGLSVGYIF